MPVQGSLGPGLAKVTGPADAFQPLGIPRIRGENFNSSILHVLQFEGQNLGRNWYETR
jgi:hypothetical protein